MAEYTYTPTPITITSPKGNVSKAYALSTTHGDVPVFAARKGSDGIVRPMWARSEDKLASILGRRKPNVLKGVKGFVALFQEQGYTLQWGHAEVEAKAKPTMIVELDDDAPTPKPSRAKVVPFVTPEVVEQVEGGLFDALEDDASEAFVLTPELIVSCWGDAEALMGLCEAAGVEVGRTRSASGLGGRLMAALQ